MVAKVPNLILVLAVELFHDEVHLLISGDVLGEEHAGSGRQDLALDYPGDGGLGGLQIGQALGQLNGLCLKLLELPGHQVCLLVQQANGVVHRLFVQIGPDLLHGKVQPAQVPDEVELVHVL